MVDPALVHRVIERVPQRFRPLLRRLV
jgi:hypothetical protein